VTTDPTCERSVTAQLRGAWAGTVQDDPKQPRYIGASAHTNNTGELTAMHFALSRALMRPSGQGREIVWSDSLYAINMTTGRWLPKSPRNREMVAHMRELWRRLQRQRDGEVELRHVRSHTNVPGNEMADWLADRGRHVCGEERVPTVEAGGWLRKRLAAVPSTLADPVGVG
jgi:ribonuclease HI